MKHQKFFICDLCKNLVGLIDDGGGQLVCCGQDMTELIPNSVDAHEEKHVPVAALEGDTLTVKVGSAPHPMDAVHYIEFVYVETARGGQRKRLKAGDAPSCTFLLGGDKPTAVFAYCNIHGLWQAEL